MGFARRPTTALITAILSLMAVLVLAGVAFAATPTRDAQAPNAASLSIYMSDTDGGPPMRTFVSSTHRLYAVVAFGEASNENFVVRLRDMVGIEVFREAVRLNGSGKLSRPVTVAAFTDAYKSRASSARDALAESIGDLDDLCKNPPGSPRPTSTPAGPTPGAPTATPDTFARWRELMLDAVVSSKTTGVEFGRTVQAMGTLPDLAADAAVTADLAAAARAVTDMTAALDRAERALSPSAPRPGTPTPDPPAMPDPAAACAAVADAAPQAATLSEKSDAVIARIPADVSTWRFPPASALYDAGRFVRCQPYIIELVAPGSGGGEGTAAASSPWVIGEPGEPALLFPGPEQTDRSELQQLGLHLPAGADTIYASTVDVDGVNHHATVSAFVTDAQCIPVDGVTITFGIDPSDSDVDPAIEASLAPREAVIHSGVATTTLTAGITATLGSEVTAVVCVGKCLRPDPGTPPTQPTTGTKPFSIIGPVRTLVFFVPKKEINRLRGERADMSVRALDALGRKVADGTSIELRIEPGSPGVLARDVRPTGSAASQVEHLGKSAQLLTRSGFSYVPPGGDPGITYSSQVYLMPFTDGDGEVELAASSDGVVARKTVMIVSEWPIYMPLTIRSFGSH